MGLSKDEIQREIIDAWRSYVKQVASSLLQLEQEVQKVMPAPGNLTDEWLQHVDQAIAEISNIIFSIGEPKWANDSDIELLKNLKKRIYTINCQLYQIRSI